MGAKHYTEEEKELIVSLYNQGRNTVEIASLLKRSQSGIERFLKKNGYTDFGLKMKFSEDETKLIVNLYKNGMTCKEIWERHFKHLYNSSAMVERLIKKMGLSRGRHKKNVVLNHDYFKDIDDEYKAYFLGFIMADGCIRNVNGNNKKIISISIDAKDKYILDIFAEKVGTDKEVKIYNRKGENSNKRRIATITLFSNKMFADLQKHNILENKTNLDLAIPKTVNKSLINHYIRGYFDGDGSVYRYVPKDQNLSRLRLSICVTESFGKDILNLFYENNIIKNINNSNLIDLRKYGNNIFNVRLNSMQDIVKFYKFIYKDSNVYLSRKKRNI